MFLLKRKQHPKRPFLIVLQSDFWSTKSFPNRVECFTILAEIFIAASHVNSAALLIWVCMHSWLCHSYFSLAVPLSDRQWDCVLLGFQNLTTTKKKRKDIFLFLFLLFVGSLYKVCFGLPFQVKMLPNVTFEFCTLHCTHLKISFTGPK